MEEKGGDACRGNIDAYKPDEELFLEVRNGEVGLGSKGHVVGHERR